LQEVEMVDFTGLGPNAGGRIGFDPASATRMQTSNAVPGTVPNALSSAVAAVAAGEKTRTDSGSHDNMAGGRKPRDGAQGEAAAGLTPHEQKLREGMLTGPSPTFEASLLELETDLKLALARIQSAGYGEVVAASDRGSPGDRRDHGSHGAADPAADTPGATDPAADRPGAATTRAEAQAQAQAAPERTAERPDTSANSTRDQNDSADPDPGDRN